jgi:hypothetical protein
LIFFPFPFDALPKATRGSERRQAPSRCSLAILPVGQTIVFCGLLEGAASPRNSMKKVAQALLPAAPAFVPALGASSPTSHPWPPIHRPCLPATPPMRGGKPPSRKNPATLPDGRTSETAALNRELFLPDFSSRRGQSLPNKNRPWSWAPARKGTEPPDRPACLLGALCFLRALCFFGFFSACFSASPRLAQSCPSLESSPSVTEPPGKRKSSPFRTPPPYFWPVNQSQDF